jgi:hypothetical protein
MRSHLHAFPEVFVFGSNLAGAHYSGAAKYAMDNCDAVMHIGEGRMGYSYALPTCSGPGIPLMLEEVAGAVDRFIAHASQYPSVNFFVTRVGCGIAGFTDEQIAPLFKQYDQMDNLILPPEWDNL